MNSELRRKIFEKASYLCQCGQGCGKQGTEIHHIIANTKLNRKLYGDKIDNKENLIVVSHSCHEKHSLWDKEKRKYLVRKFENELDC